MNVIIAVNGAELIKSIENNSLGVLYRAGVSC